MSRYIDKSTKNKRLRNGEDVFFHIAPSSIETIIERDRRSKRVLVRIYLCHRTRCTMKDCFPR